MLLEAQAGEFVIGNLRYLDGAYGRLPIGGGEEVLGAEAGGEEIANYFMTLGDEEVLSLAELFLLQLAHIFNLIFTYHIITIFLRFHI